MKQKNILKTIAGLTLVALTVSACSGFKQDPFADKIEAIKNANPPDNTPDFQKPISGDFVTLDVPSTIIFKENKMQTLVFNVKTYLEGYTYEVTIKDLSALSGATYNSTNSTLSWNPGPGVVPAGVSVKSFDLNVDIIATPKAGSGHAVPLRKESIVTIYVENAMDKPVIKSVDYNNQLIIEEGTSTSIIIKAEDNVTAGGNLPTLVATAKSSTKTVAPYVRVNKVAYDFASRLWVFNATVDLSIADITRSYDTAPVVLSVVNEQGIMSAPYAIDFSVLAKVGTPQTTFPSTLPVKVGQLNTVNFAIYNSMADVVMNLETAAGFPSGAQVTCGKTQGSFSQCAMEWTPSATDMGQTFYGVLTVKTQTTSLADTRQVVGTVPVNFSVTAK